MIKGHSSQPSNITQLTQRALKSSGCNQHALRTKDSTPALTFNQTCTSAFFSTESCWETAAAAAAAASLQSRTRIISPAVFLLVSPFSSSRSPKDPSKTKNEQSALKRPSKVLDEEHQNMNYENVFLEWLAFCFLHDDKGKTDAQVTAPRWRPVSAVCFSNHNVPTKSKKLTYIKL